jgi:hypothetical protein
VRGELVSQPLPSSVGGGGGQGETRIHLGVPGASHGLVGAAALLGEPINVPSGLTVSGQS